MIQSILKQNNLVLFLFVWRMIYLKKKFKNQLPIYNLYLICFLIFEIIYILPLTNKIIRNPVNNFILSFESINLSLIILFFIFYNIVLSYLLYNFIKYFKIKLSLCFLLAIEFITIKFYTPIPSMVYFDPLDPNIIRRLYGTPRGRDLLRSIDGQHLGLRHLVERSFDAPEINKWRQMSHSLNCLKSVMAPHNQGPWYDILTEKSIEFKIEEYKILFKDLKTSSFDPVLKREILHYLVTGQ